MEKCKIISGFLVIIFWVCVMATPSFGQLEVEMRQDGVIFPRMDTLTRNALMAEAGQVIYNTSDSCLNAYNGSRWLEIGNLKLADLDGDTRIEVEKTTDDDVVRISSGGLEVIRIHADSLGRERVEITNSLANTYVGKASGVYNEDGSYNSFYGYESGRSNTGGSSNAFFGSLSGWMNTTGQDNSFFGAYAGANNTSGNFNAFYGESAGLLNIDGDFNAYYGYGSGEQNTNGFSNCFFGGFAGQQNTTGYSNAFFGAQAGQIIEEGIFNSFFGERVALFKERGSHNTYIGQEAGQQDRSGSKNTLIGSGSDFASGMDSLNGSMALGYNARVGCHNCVVIGGTEEDSVNVGIGTATPVARLQVEGGDIRIVGGGIYVEDTLLNVPDYVFAADYELTSLKEVEAFIKTNSHLEGFPSMHDRKAWYELSLQSRDMLLLQKVEEIFLHLINQEKRLAKQIYTLKSLISKFEQLEGGKRNDNSLH